MAGSALSIGDDLLLNSYKHNASPPYNTCRLRFTDAERADPALTKTIRKVDKDADKLEVVWAKIHKKKILKARRTVDAETGKSTVRLCFGEIGRKTPPYKLTHAVREAPANAVLLQLHREIRQSEADNVGVEAVHKSEETAELSARAGRSAYRSRKLKPYRKSAKAESRLDRANLDYLQKKAVQDGPRASGNPLSHWRQKQAVAVCRREARWSVHGFCRKSCRKHCKNRGNGSNGKKWRNVLHRLHRDLT